MTNKNKFLQGTIKRHPDGFGFFIPNDTSFPDVYIPAHSMKSAMTSDHVTIRAEKERDGRYRGEIIRIEKRAHQKIAGAFHIMNDRWGYIKDEGRGWGKDLKISLEKSMNAKAGELVVARVQQFPDEGDFLGEVTSIIGDASSALNDIKRVIVTQNIPEDFSEATLTEAKKFNHDPTESDFKNRRDLRQMKLITIDGSTAKDFDDAVYVEMNNSGFRLVVAIADVSHYVKPGTSMDKDAYERGTSVYFPNFVVPMLPEALSNGLCSLNPHVPRLALVADMIFDFNGEMTKSTFYEAVIESKARVTYGEAQEIIEGNTSDKLKHVEAEIKLCADLAKLLMAKRFKDGSLDLEVPETELVIDGAGEPVDVIKSERLFAHRLIEEMMLAANIAVAKQLSNKEIPALYRTHEPPDPMKMTILEKYLKNFGAKTSLTGDRLQKKLTKALHEFTNENQAQVIHILTLRSMSQAKYTLENIGHFGLGFDFYTHFTSPIRRYPDLIVHRLLKNSIGLTQYRLMPEDDVATAGTWLSACEQRSAKAERQIHAIKKARFMKKLVGESYDGFISSVTKFGVFVLLREYNIDGLVRMEDLGQGNWEYDEENLKLVAPRSGQSYTIGDKIRVTVSSVDIEQGQINFVLEGQVEKALARNTKRTVDADNKVKVFKASPTKAKKSPSYETSQKTPATKDGATIKPRYASLADYLEQTANKKKTESKTTSFSKKDNKSQGKSENDRFKTKNKGSQNKYKDKDKHSTSKSSKNRKDSEKRQSPENDSQRVRKAWPKKSSRKNKPR